MITLLGVVIGLIILTVIVALHEFGHGLAARRHGVVVQEFGIGFPPRAKAWLVKKSILGKNVNYTLNWLPLGGFVKLQGEHDTDNAEGDYGRATFWHKTQILLAGVVANWLTAVVLLAVLSLFGVPKILDNQFHIASDTYETTSRPIINFVEPGSPADKAGLKLNDQIVSINGKALASADELAKITASQKGRELNIKYSRDGVEATTNAQLRANNDDGKGYLGISDYEKSSLRATWSAPIVGFGLTWQFTVATYQGLGSMVDNLATGIAHKFQSSESAQKEASAELTAAGNSVAGPVGLLGTVLPSLVQAGPGYVILIAAVIAISLAAINILPIPALDGGRWFWTAVFRLFKRPLSAEVEERINGYGFLFLMLLFVVITIVDVTRFF